MHVRIQRTLKNEHQTLGTLTVFDDNDFPLWQCKTLELPDKGNQRKISCIPEGEYEVVKRYSDKYKDHFHITGVPNRDWILIHTGNFTYQVLGCIMVGLEHTDMDGDGLQDITSSKTTLKGLNEKLPEKFKLEIYE